MTNNKQQPHKYFYQEQCNQIASLYNPRRKVFTYSHVHLYGLSGTGKVTTLKTALLDRQAQQQQQQQMCDNPLDDKQMMQDEDESDITIIEYNALLFGTVLNLEATLLSKIYQYKKPKYIKGHQTLIDAVQKHGPIAFIVRNFNELTTVSSSGHQAMRDILCIFNSVYQISGSKCILCTTGQTCLSPMILMQTPQSLYHSCLQIYFSHLDKSSLEQYLVDHVCPIYNFNIPFVKLFLSTIYSHIRPIQTIVQTLSQLHTQFIGVVKDIRGLARNMEFSVDSVTQQELIRGWAMIQSSVKQLLLKHSIDPFLRGGQHQQIGATSHNSSRIYSQSGLSETHQYLLISAYMASNSDAKKDSTLFGTSGNSKSDSKKKKVRKTTSSSSKTGYKKASGKKREFDITRLLAIMNNLILNQSKQTLRHHLQNDINSCVRDLVMRQYLIVKDPGHLSSSSSSASSSSSQAKAHSATELSLDKMWFTLSEIIDYDRVQEFCKNCDVELEKYGISHASDD